MKYLFVAALLVGLVSASFCQSADDEGDDDAPQTAVAAADAPSKCSCILPLVLLPANSQVTSGILNNLLQGGLLNVNDASTLKYLLGGGQITAGLLNNLLQGGLLNGDVGNLVKYLLGGGQVTGGLLNNLLQAGLLNSSDLSNLLASQSTGGIGNNILQGGIGNDLLQVLLGKGLLGGLLGSLLAIPSKSTTLPAGTSSTAAGTDGGITAPETSDQGSAGVAGQKISGLLSGLLSRNILAANLLSSGSGNGPYGALANTDYYSGVLGGLLNGNLALLNVGQNLQ